MGCKKQGVKNRALLSQKEKRHLVLFYLKFLTLKKYQVDLIN